MVKSAASASRRQAAGAACIALLAVALAACASPQKAPTALAADAVAASDAAAIYHRRCSVCHGEKGDGKSYARSALAKEPRDFTTDEARLTLTREYMIAIVRDGRPGKPMVARKTQLEQREIEAVVDLIRSAFIPPEPGTPLARGRGAYASFCATCHGDRGQGGGRALRGIPAPPVAIARAGSRLTRDRLVAAAGDEKHRAAVGHFGQPLTAPDIDAIAGYIERSFIEGIGLGETAESRAFEPSVH
jgi:mono/diheme cytochrome c family protein